MRFHRWVFWVYLAFSIPTLLAMFVFKVHGDTNAWFWLFGTLMLILSLPWLFAFLGTANLPVIGIAIVANALILWWFTRPAADDIPKKPGECSAIQHDSTGETP